MTPDQGTLPPKVVAPPGYLRLRVAPQAINAAILDHPEFAGFKATVTARFAAWQTAASVQLKAFGKDGRPKVLIEALSESLLEAFRKVPLLDAYDVYQHLMDYAAETLEDDAYRIAEAGWIEAAKPQLIVDDKAKKTKARPDFAVGRRKYQAELIPPALLIARYFAKEQAAIEALEVSRAALEQQMEEMVEEQGGEGGLLEEAKTDKDKFTKASVTARLKEIRTDREAADERQAVQAYLALIEQEAEIAAKLKTAEDALMEKVMTKYSKLGDVEIKTLVVDDKWLATLDAAVQGELNQVSQTLTGRVRELAGRYSTPLPQITEKVAEFATLVSKHLEGMGASWK
jgi:type I restriction enzyme M protein